MKLPEIDPQILEPGWAGANAPDELAFVKAALLADRNLRARWGFIRGTGRLRDDKIRQVAMFGPSYT